MYAREDNSLAIHVYKKIGFKEHWKRLWVSVNTVKSLYNNYIYDILRV
ncbi:GNAT family N-acetyltransferase [Acidianus infernus]